MKARLSALLLLILVAGHAHALSGSRAGSAYSQDGYGSHTNPRECALLQAKIERIDRELDRAGGNSAERLRRARAHYQNRLARGGCDRSLR